MKARIDFAPLGAETLPLAASLGRVLAADVIAPVDAPPFDRSNVDGFAVRAADTAGARDGAPKRLSLNAEVIACGVDPAIEVGPGTATAIATGGVIPRGADAVVMIEQTELLEDTAAPAIDLRRAAASGQFISYAGSDIARGETLLRRGTAIGSREIGHARRLRVCDDRGGAPPARRRAVDRRRTRRARPTAASRRRL